MNISKIAILLAVLFVASLAFAEERRMPSHLDCSASELKKAEIQFQELSRPLLVTYGEQYSGDKKVFEEKEQKRAKLFREWLNMRCICKPKQMSRLEKTLCQALTENLSVSGRDVCLVQN